MLPTSRDAYGTLAAIARLRRWFTILVSFCPMFSTAYNTASPWLTPVRWGYQISQPPAPHAGVHSLVTNHSNPSSTALGSRCSWTYSNERSAGLVYPDRSGGLKQWTPASGWRELNLSSCWYSSKPPASGPLGSDHVLRLLPQTSLQLDSGAGATRIVINRVADADPVSGRRWTLVPARNAHNHKSGSCEPGDRHHTSCRAAAGYRCAYATGPAAARVSWRNPGVSSTHRLDCVIARVRAAPTTCGSLP